jgi:hypothetical protein
VFGGLYGVLYKIFKDYVLAAALVLSVIGLMIVALANDVVILMVGMFIDGGAYMVAQSAVRLLPKITTTHNFGIVI